MNDTFALELTCEIHVQISKYMVEKLPMQCTAR